MDPLRQLELSRRLTELLQDFLLADRAAAADQPGGDVGPRIDFAIRHHSLLEVNGFCIQTNDPGLDGVTLPKLERFAEGNRFPGCDRRPSATAHLFPGAASSHQVKAAKVHQGKIHAVVDVEGDVYVGRKNPQRQ